MILKFVIVETNFMQSIFYKPFWLLYFGSHKPAIKLVQRIILETRCVHEEQIISDIIFICPVSVWGFF